jgi:hypothetical protein
VSSGRVDDPADVGRATRAPAPDAAELLQRDGFSIAEAREPLGLSLSAAPSTTPRPASRFGTEWSTPWREAMDRERRLSVVMVAKECYLQIGGFSNCAAIKGVLQ